MLRSCTALAPHFRVKEFAQYTRPRVKDQREQTPAMVLQMKRISGKGGIFDTRVAVIAPSSCAVDDGSENYQVLLCMRNSYIGLNEVISDIGRWSSVFLCISTIAWLHRLGVMWTPFNSLFVAFLAVTGCHGVSQPNVQLGSTTLIGKRLQASSLDFFWRLLPSDFDPMAFLPLAVRYPLRRTSNWRPPPFSSEAKVFPLPPAVIRRSQLR